MAKCNACGRFVSSTDGATCAKCKCAYDRECVGLPPTGPKPTSWHCPECRKHEVRDNRADTPVRGRVPAALEESVVNLNLMDTSPATSAASDATQEISLNLFRTELAIFKEDFIKAVRKEFQLVRNDLSELRSSINATNNRMSALEERVAVLESTRAQTQVSSEVNDLVKQLRSDINDRDQELLANDVQISNIPEVSGENPTHLALLIANKIGVNIEERDIVSAERVGGRRINATHATGPVETRPRFLVVRVTRRDLRDKLLQEARVRRGMTTADLGLSGTRRIYINERLTKVNRELFRSAREAGSRLGWQFVWSKRGRIFARCKPGDAIHCIRCEGDLQRIFVSTPSNDGI